MKYEEHIPKNRDATQTFNVMGNKQSEDVTQRSTGMLALNNLHGFSGTDLGYANSSLVR